eukprot:TRINITY_DN16335_c0_g1_i1.p1 TRINITY_DN16335_c0_g1~~TRINITY_DN16335_c0_g1_i1.p1  ORF type:complete len:365 (+),score=77.21 TRINITY_DN16335_c0_g1_i1:240-1334(+)
MSSDRFYYIVNDDYYQRIQIYMKYNITKKLLNSYSFFFKLVGLSNNVSFRIRLQDFERKLLGGSCDRFGASANLVLGIEHDFRIYNEGGYYDVDHFKNRFRAALDLLEENKRKMVESWARGEDVVVFELHAQQVIGNKTKKDRAEGKVQLEYRPKKSENTSTFTIDTWDKPVEVYANTRRRNKGSLRGPRGKRLGDEEKTTLAKKIKLENSKSHEVTQKEKSSLDKSTLLLHMLNQELHGVSVKPATLLPTIKKEKGCEKNQKHCVAEGDHSQAYWDNFFAVPIKQEKGCQADWSDSCSSYSTESSTSLNDGHFKDHKLSELWQELIEPANAKLSIQDVQRELGLNWDDLTPLTTDEVLAMMFL